MKRFVPKGKLSKKKRGEADRQGRRVWTVQPVTRLKESGKRYTRRRKHARDDSTDQQ
ncbi:MAG: hypothetical protein GX653_09755 [Clostridiales bacterium]|nr:hypothetical protein [Clostridiales bacterium]